VGILGGTFDPPHIGHIEIARLVRSSLSLDEVLLVVANDPWQKSGRGPISSPQDRLAMVDAAVADIRGLRASSVEIDRGGPSYTVDTLTELAAQDPTAQFFLIVGADAAAGLDTWIRYEELPTLATLVIVDRPGAEAIDPPGEWDVVRIEGPRLDVASSWVRGELEQGLGTSDVITSAVREYIADHELYAARHG
jgi:nicotinate-nucleotide adenylyltransferase